MGAVSAVDGFQRRHPVLGFPLAVAWIVGKVVLAIGLWGGAIVGYLAGPLPWPLRLAAAAAALLLVLALPVTDELGLALAAVVLGLVWWRRRRAAPA